MVKVPCIYAESAENIRYYRWNYRPGSDAEPSRKQKMQRTGPEHIKQKKDDEKKTSLSLERVVTFYSKEG